jgi:hypothetical protein
VKRSGRAVFWILLAAFVAAGVGWILYVPYDPVRLYRAIPADATLVSTHDNLAARWEQALRDPVALAVLRSLGVKDKDLANLARNRAPRRWLRRMASRRTVFAYLPGVAPDQPPAWAAATWIGAHGHQLRWALFWTWTRRLRVLRLEDGRPCWSWRVKTSDGEVPVSFALSEGVLVACLSDDPLAVRRLLQSLDGLPWCPSVLAGPLPERARRLWPPDRSDRGWLPVAERHRLPAFGPTLLAYGLDIAPGTGACLRVRADAALPAAPLLCPTGHVAALARLLGNAPDLLCLCPATYLSLADGLPVPPAWVRLLRELLAEGERGPEGQLFAAVLDAQHAGRIRGPLGSSLTPFIQGIKVPTVLAGWRSDMRGDAMEQRLSAALDRMNRTHRTGLIPHPIAIPPYTVIAIEETRDSFYGRFEREERVACLLADGWVVICSNLRALRKLLEETRDGSLPDWAAQITGQSSEAALWANPAALSQTLRDAAAATILALYVRDAAGTVGTRKQLALTKAWLEGLRPFDRFSAGLTSGAGVSVLDAVLHAAPPPPGGTVPTPEPPPNP